MTDTPREPSARDRFVPGHVHRPEDDRDWTIPEVIRGEHLTVVRAADEVGPLHKALAYVLRWCPKSLGRLLTLIVDKLEPVSPLPPPGPAPVPAPPPPEPAPSGAVRWETPFILDQGETPHCVGFTGADWRADAPTVDPTITGAVGHAIYAACKQIDGDPTGDGSDMRSLGKVLVAAGRSGGYAFATSITDVLEWLHTRGTVMLGLAWHDDMFNPDPDTGIIRPTGKVVGGHALSAIGHDPATGLVELQNHWGHTWGRNGFAFITAADLDALLSREDGEALVMVELPIV